jgi:predicted nucleic acid-binding protein
MVAFFDTSIHIDILRGTISVADVLEAAGNPPVRLSPVVASELLRRVSGRATRSVMRLVRGLLPLEPPSWRSCWLETGRLLPRVFPDYEAVGLARLQNDLLLALTARHTGSLFVTGDEHFRALRRYVSFAVKVLPST